MDENTYYLFRAFGIVAQSVVAEERQVFLLLSDDCSFVYFELQLPYWVSKQLLVREYDY
jgi:hypothetical protein